MTCVKCNKHMLECNCPDIIKRLLWLISPDSPMHFTSNQQKQYITRIKELQGYRELNDIGN